MSFEWRTSEAASGSQLLTLFCSNCFKADGGDGQIPVLSVLRDTLGDKNAENDRISYVWLLGVPNLTAGQQVLSAVPFFYWRPHHGAGKYGASEVKTGNLKPQENFTAPQDPMMSDFTRRLVQWTAFDPLTSWVRAPSRSYQANQLENVRFHLEETISYLRQAPVASDGSALTDGELKTVIARLELRKSMMGGLVDNRHAERFGDEAGFEEERVRSRNWEVLRQCAEKTDLYFEPVELGGAEGSYGMLWYEAGSPQPPGATPVKPIWSMLSISDPRSDNRLRNWDGLSFERAVDGEGRLLSEGAEGVRRVKLVPLAFYSLTYPKAPLLLADFRDRLHVRRHEMLQRSITQLTSGVIGISRFTNWYYYAGAMAYNFVTSRHGGATSQVERLDSYSQFRVHLALDRSLNPKLHEELARRANSLVVNPLDDTGKNAVALARVRYAALMEQIVPDSGLSKRLARDRRKELAVFGQTPKQQIGHEALHFATLGIYTQRVPKSRLDLAQIARERRFSQALSYLNTAVNNGTQPEVAYDSKEIAASIAALQELSPSVTSPGLLKQATATLQKVSALTKDQMIVADCRQALTGLQGKPVIAAQSGETQVAATSSMFAHGSK